MGAFIIGVVIGVMGKTAYDWMKEEPQGLINAVGAQGRLASALEEGRDVLREIRDLLRARATEGSDGNVPPRRRPRPSAAEAEGE